MNRDEGSYLASLRNRSVCIKTTACTRDAFCKAAESANQCRQIYSNYVAAFAFLSTPDIYLLDDIVIITDER